MSLQTVWNYTSRGDAFEMNVPDLGWSNDWLKRDTRKNDEAVLSNLTSPLGAAESVRFAYQKVSNVYKGTGIEPAMHAPSKTGFSMLAQVNDVLIVTDTETGMQTYLPFSAHVVIRGPQHVAVTAEHVDTLICRLVGTLYDGPDSGLQRIDAFMRGAVLPKALY